MNTRRLAKVNQAVRQVVSMTILKELRDPRVHDVTVLGVQVAPDLRSASVAVSVMGDAGEQALALQGLRSARGFLQARIADELNLQYTPVLDFKLDDAVKQSIAVSRLLREIDDAGPQPDAGDEFEPDEQASPAGD